MPGKTNRPIPALAPDQASLSRQEPGHAGIRDELAAGPSARQLCAAASRLMAFFKREETGESLRKEKPQATDGWAEPYFSVAR